MAERGFRHNRGEALYIYRVTSVSIAEKCRFDETYVVRACFDEKGILSTHYGIHAKDRRFSIYYTVECRYNVVQ